MKMMKRENKHEKEKVEEDKETGKKKVSTFNCLPHLNLIWCSKT